MSSDGSTTPPTAQDDRWVAALDVGGMSVKFGATSTSGEVRGLSRIPLDNAGPADTLLTQLSTAVRRARLAAPEPAAAVAVAFPAPFEYEAGVPRLRHKFAALHGVDLRAELLRRVPTEEEVSFVNDAAAAALGEAAYGTARSNRRLLMITLGTGLGACVVEAGRPVDEPAANEIPELYRQETDAGSADDLFSARGLAARLDVPVGQLEKRIDEVRASGVALEALAGFGTTLGTFLAPHVRATDPTAIIVGGGAGGALDLFGPALEAAAGRPVAAASLGQRAPLLGALVHAIGPPALD